MEISSSAHPAAAAKPFGKILVTGACGFIGANLCRYFAARGGSIVAVDGPSGNDWRLRDRRRHRRSKGSSRW
jgi:nucleoside-diphosphate-sugar epimerase